MILHLVQLGMLFVKLKYSKYYINSSEEGTIWIILEYAKIVFHRLYHIETVT